MAKTVVARRQGDVALGTLRQSHSQNEANSPRNVAAAQEGTMTMSVLPVIN